MYNTTWNCDVTAPDVHRFLHPAWTYADASSSSLEKKVLSHFVADCSFCGGAELDQHLNLIGLHFDLWLDLSVDGLRWWNYKLLLIRGLLKEWREGLSEGNSVWTFPTTGRAVTGTQSNYQSNDVQEHQCLDTENFPLLFPKVLWYQEM